MGERFPVDAGAPRAPESRAFAAQSPAVSSAQITDVLCNRLFNKSVINGESALKVSAGSDRIESTRNLGAQASGAINHRPAKRRLRDCDSECDRYSAAAAARLDSVVDCRRDDNEHETRDE